MLPFLPKGVRSTYLPPNHVTDYYTTVVNLRVEMSDLFGVTLDPFLSSYPYSLGQRFRRPHVRARTTARVAPNNHLRGYQHHHQITSVC